MSRGVRKEGLIRKRLLWLLGAGIAERERMGIEVFFIPIQNVSISQPGSWPCNWSGAQIVLVYQPAVTFCRRLGPGPHLR